MFKHCVLAALLSAASLAQAANPIVKNIFTADPAAQIEQRRIGAAQRVGHARVQRIAAELRACVVIVVAARQERAGNRFRGAGVERARR